MERLEPSNFTWVNIRCFEFIITTFTNKHTMINDLFFYKTGQIPLGLNVKITCVRVFVYMCLCTFVGACMCVRTCIDEHAYLGA